jgi:hypothetical protein
LLFVSLKTTYGELASVLAKNKKVKKVATLCFFFDQYNLCLSPSSHSWTALTRAFCLAPCTATRCA